MESCVVMVVARPDVAAGTLLAGGLPCPLCRGVLRPFGNGRARTVRGIGSDTVTVTPRRARCADCRVTQILFPTGLTVRRADSTEAIGNALVAKAGGAGYRSIATRFGRPESTVRGWLRGVREPHAQWLYRRGVDRAAAIDRELLVRPAPQRSVLGHALNLLAGARAARPGSVRRGRPGVGVDRLLRPRPAPGVSARAAQLKSGSRVALPCPAVSVTVPTKVRPTQPGHRHFADQAVTSPTTQPISVFIHVDAFNGRTDDGQQLMRTDPFRDLDRLTQQLLGTNARPSVMLMDAWRDGDKFVVEFDLPGVSPDSVDLNVERNVLTVTAQRPPLDETAEFLAAERTRGVFSRQLVLGDNLNLDRIEAAYRDGVLRLHIPVAEKAKPRKITINRDASDGDQAITTGHNGNGSNHRSADSTVDAETVNA